VADHYSLVGMKIGRENHADIFLVIQTLAFLHMLSVGDKRVKYMDIWITLPVFYTLMRAYFTGRLNQR